MRVGSGVILFQLAGFLTSALADFYFAKHTQPEAERMPAVHHAQYSSINFARNLCSIQKQHSSVSNSMIILLQLETGRRETVRLTRRRKAQLL